MPVAAMIAQLKDYLAHKAECCKRKWLEAAPVRRWAFRDDCTCGLDDLTALLSQQEQEQKATRVDEGQPRRIAPTGSTATGNELPVSDSDDA